MRVHVVVFGQLAEITGKEFQADVADTHSLSTALEAKFSALKQARYVIAVNKKIVTTNTVLTAADTVALLPPFSGG